MSICRCVLFKVPPAPSGGHYVPSHELYQVGGYTALVPRASVQPINMSFEEVMRFILTAGLSAPAAKSM